MSARNTQAHPETADRLVSIKSAMTQLGITSAGAFAAAVKAHAYLKDGIVPANDEFKRRIWQSAVDRYERERGDRGGARDGLKWFMIRCDEASAASLRTQGFEVVKPADRAKAKAAESNGVETTNADEDRESFGSDELEEVEEV